MARKHRPPIERSAERVDVVALVVASILLLVGCLAIHPFIPDDAYISFRFAEHLVDGDGLVFNVGEPPVEAYSNFLWILFCAVLYRVGLDLPATAPFVGVGLALACVVLFWTLARRRAVHDAQLVLPLVLLATSTPFVLYAVSGMESALFAFLLLVTAFYADAVYRRPARSSWAGLAASGFALALARPEGVVVLPFVAATIAWDTRGDRARGAIRRGAAVSFAAFVVAYAAYTLWRVSYFGEWLPTPFVSKGYEAFPVLTAWKSNLRQFFITGTYLEAPFGYYFVAIAALGVAALSSLRDGESESRGDRLCLVLSSLLAILYVNFVDWMPAMRYHAALIPLLLLPVVRLQRFVPDAAWRASPPARRGLALAAAVLVLIGAFAHQRMKIVSMTLTESNVETYVPLGRWLANAVPPNSLIAIGDVGAVPYYSRMRTLDIHPESLTDRHIARDGFTVDYVLGRRPDVVALYARGVYSAKMDPLHYEMYHSDAFVAAYNFVGTVRHRWNLDGSHWIFARKSLRFQGNALESFPSGMGTQRRLGFQPRPAAEQP